MTKSVERFGIQLIYGWVASIFWPPILIMVRVTAGSDPYFARHISYRFDRSRASVCRPRPGAMKSISLRSA